ncbi:hypothetical protein EOL70_16840 [Leucothrix sargassi]|nr:hypothetical protein EOL70_16840 [Leucothrix sargassi]
MSDALTNKGIVALGKVANKPINKVVVIGTARGGTSLVAGVLSHLGIFMGDESRAPVFEDLKLARAFETNDLETAKKIVDEYCELYELWGWKRPSSINYLDSVDKVFDGPSYIFIYKDIISIAQRNAISMHDDVIQGMQRASIQYAQSIEFLSKNNLHSLLVSFDKALSNAEVFVDSIIAFTKISPTTEQRANAISFITPNPIEYLDQSRITKTQGRLGGLDQRVIFGWARYVHPSMNKSAEVELYLNDNKVAVVKADQFRADLNKEFGQNCAFKYLLPEDLNINPGDVFRARVVADLNDLPNSPLIIE